MNFIHAHIKWIMVVAGVLTCTMVLAAVAPQLALQRTFGDTLDGPLANVVVRSWGVLITLVGAMLIYAAFNPVHRKLVLFVAATSKAALIGLIAGPGSSYMAAATPVLVFDSLMVVIFTLVLLDVGATKHDASSA
ncbi:MAG: hypothetical protein Q8K97_14115 [Pseudohongiella sp.]|nr:hypothetical protein [Pseudohongiella sp.]